MRNQLRKEATVIIAWVKEDTTTSFPTGPFPPALLAVNSITQRLDLLQFGPSQHLNLFPLSHLGGNHEANKHKARDSLCAWSPVMWSSPVMWFGSFIMRFHTFTPPCKRYEWQPVVKVLISSNPYQMWLYQHIWYSNPYQISYRLDSKATH